MSNKAQLDPKAFQGVVDGKEVRLYSLTNKQGAEAHFINQGAKLVSLIVPSRSGWTDVVIGHDSLQEYLDSEEAYFGAICGRYANRVAKGSFSLDGESYQLPINNGPNALHGGLKGFNAVIWDAEQTAANKIAFRYVAADGEEGYPGKLHVEVVYTLTEENELTIEYCATTSKPTILNLTNHSYFNLSGDGDASVHDHSYILDKPLGKLGRAARCSSPKTGIVMEVYTDQPGVQLYTGNWMSGNMRGKHGHRYPARAALCLETQHYPDSPNRPEYPSTRLDPGQEFRSTTAFRFTVEG